MKMDTSSYINGYTIELEKKDLKKIKFKDKSAFKKYISLINTCQKVPYEDRLFFLDDLLDAIEVLTSLIYIDNNELIYNETINIMKEKIDIVEDRLKSYNERGISEFERKKYENDLKKFMRNIYKDYEKDNPKDEYRKLLLIHHKQNENK